MHHHILHTNTNKGYEQEKPVISVIPSNIGTLELCTLGLAERNIKDYDLGF